MTEKDEQKASLSEKKGIRILIGLTLGILLGFSIAGIIFGQAIFVDTFEEYELGDLANGNWHTTGNSYQVSDNKAHTGSKSIKGKPNVPSYVYRTGEEVSIGSLRIYFYIVENFGTWDTALFFREEAFGDTLGIVAIDNFENNRVRLGEITIAYNLEFEVWHRLEIKWDSSTDQMKARVNEDNWSDWIEAGSPVNFINTLDISCNAVASQYVYLDDIEDFYSPISGETLFIEFENPLVCENNQITEEDLANFNVKGILRIPENAKGQWGRLCFKFSDYWDLTIYKNHCLFPDPLLEAGDFLEFDFSIDLSDTFTTSSAIVFNGHSFGQDEDFSPLWFFFPEECWKETLIYVNRPYFLPEEPIFPEYPELEDCSGYPLLEKLVCEIKNALKSLYIPDKEKVLELQNNLEEIKKKFPMNYLGNLKNFFSEIEAGLNESAVISFSILGREANVNLSFWDKEVEIGGIVQSFGHIVKNIGIFFVLTGFLVYAINFGRRIFK